LVVDAPTGTNASQSGAPPLGDGPAPQGVSAQLEPQSRLDRILSLVPRALSSHAHIIFLGALGTYLVLLPLFGVAVSSKSELIGGNYTNVTSDLGACIAAGLTVHLVKRDRKRSARAEELFDSLHSRHDELEKQMARTMAAAERAEAAVKGSE
jgi:hypothetical protein